jgi:hypothetical protein
MSVNAISKYFFFLLVSTIVMQTRGQNTISLNAGFLGTYTAVAEYERIDRRDYLLDSVTLSKNVGSFQASMSTEIGLGSNFYFSPGFHYSQKGLSRVDFTDTTGYTWTTPAKQHYVGLSSLIGYRYQFRESNWGLFVSTGLQADFAVGTPNGGALFSGPLYRFFMPFCRFNEVDLSWASEAGCSYKAGPGNLLLKIRYLYGLSDVLEDAFVVGRSMSYGITIGYSISIGK